MLLRSLLLKLAQNGRVVDWVTRLGARSGLTRRFIAGETLAEAVETVQELNDRDILATLALLGEEVTDRDEARQAGQTYLQLLDEIHRRGARSHVSIKLTQLGLKVGPSCCLANVAPILEKARSLDNFVRIDMEGSASTQLTLELFEGLFEDYGPHVGMVLQAYLYRTEEDARRLASRGCNIRLCKGAYWEPPEIAFPKKRDVDRNFIRLLEILLTSPAYTAVASHDLRVVRHTQEFVKRHGIHRSRYEFQMLLGIRRDQQMRVQSEGYTLRVYVPFGKQWAPYFVRRLGERPANLAFLLKNLVRR